jgi:hypothetical protein
LAVSCVDEVVPYQEEAAYVSEDAITDAYFEDADDMAGIVLLADEGPSTGGKVNTTRPITVNGDSRFCPGVVITIAIDPESTPEHPIGDITIDFGTEGCTDLRGNVRKGIIHIHFEGKRFQPGSTVVTTFEGYEINGIKLGGTRTLTNVTPTNQDYPKFKVELVDGWAEWPDGTTATREHCFLREWIVGAIRADDQLRVSSCDGVIPTASGVNRRGVAYEMNILETLIYKRCSVLAVAGVKEFTANGKTITIDYGDGECDRIVVITVNGQSRDVRVDRR